MYQSPDSLKQSISRLYGFQEELIENPELCGLWHVRFSVNKINYYGYIAHTGAEPCLKVTGYSYEYYDHELPVTEEYYNEFIKDKKLRLLKRKELEDGDFEWDDTGIRFTSVDEYNKFIETSNNGCNYEYDYESYEVT